MKKQEKEEKKTSLTAQFWNDEVKIDKESPLTKATNDLWNGRIDKVDMEKLSKDLKEYHNKKKSTQ